MLGLTPKQKEELNQAIHEYLLKHKYNQAADYFVQEANIQF
jgi:LisH